MNDKKAHELFDAYRGSAAMLLTLICLVFITFFVVFILCCGVCDKEGPKSTFWIVLAWLLFIVFLALMVGAIVFLGKSQKKIKKVLCSIYYLPSGVIDGIKDDGNEFIGLGNLKNAYTSFITEQDSLKGLTPDMNTV